MSIQHHTPLITKNLWRIIRSLLYTINNNIPWFELHTLLKRSTKLAGKLVGNLHHHHQTLTCRPTATHTTVIAPVEYEFSCSDTPLFLHKRKHHHRRRRYSGGTGGSYRKSRNDYELTVSDVKRVFDVLNGYDAAAATVAVEAEKSPLTALGVGECGNVRQLRVTDSPFAEEDTAEEGVQVDAAAEEFIRKFYRELKQQKRSAAVEPPSPVVDRRWGKVR